jgi:ferredoxin
MDRKPTTDELYELLTRGSRISLDAVKQHPNGAVFPEKIVAAPKDPQCTARLQVGDVEMVAELAEVAAERVGDSADFPYRLICRRSAHVYNSTGRDLPLLIQKGGRHNPAFMNPADLADLGLQTGDVVQVCSRHGNVLAIVEAEDSLRRGLVSMTHAFGDLPRDGADFRVVGSNTEPAHQRRRRLRPLLGHSTHERACRSRLSASNRCRIPAAACGDVSQRAKQRSAMKVAADVSKCCSSGMCTVRAPQVFGQREEDGLVVVLEPHPPTKWHQAARDAAAACPVAAIKVYEDE